MGLRSACAHEETPPVFKPGPASSKKRSISPTSSVESASSAGSKPPKRRASPVMELVTGSRNSGQRTLCNRCGIRFESDVDYTKHMRIHESRKRTAIESKKNPAGLKKPKVEVPEEKPNVNKMQVRLEEEPPHVPCTDCDMQFKTEKEREKHMQSEHAHVPQFPCHLCGLTYLARPQLDNHVMTVHEGRSKSCVYTCWICSENNVHKSYQKKPLLESHLKSVHKIPRNQIDFSKMPDLNSNGASEATNDDDGTASTSGENNDTSVVKRLRLDGDEQFTCAKCNFVSKEREEFQTHIAKHKSVEEDALQCHECGMSFMVMPSLKRHLFMVHKIRNLKRYQEEAGVNLESPVKPVEGMRLRISHNAVLQNGYSSRESDSARDSDTEHDSSVMECTVCYKEFESQSQLRKHMRMHGMAFIRSRRLDSGIN